jgi:hypothetical protein
VVIQLTVDGEGALSSEDLPEIEHISSWPWDIDVESRVIWTSAQQQERKLTEIVGQRKVLS